MNLKPAYALVLLSCIAELGACKALLKKKAGMYLLGTFASQQFTGADLADLDFVAFPEVAADIGFVGLAILLSLFGRLGLLAWRAAGRGFSSGWIALGVLTVVLLDALTRESLTGFPTAYIGMLLLGLACATWTAEGRGASATAPAG